MKESFDLDQALERMKRETPEVPADFHARWMDAVRGEAEASAPPAAGEKKGVAQWRRILSMVAIAIFLVGGTLLTRGRLNAMILKKNGEPVRWKTAEGTKTDTEKEESESDAAESAPAANEAMAYNQAAQSAPMNEAGESAGGAAEYDAAGYDAAVYDAAMYSEAAYDAPAYEGVVSGEANLTMAGGAASTEARRSALMTSAAVTEETAEMEEAAEMDEAPEMAVAATNAPAAKAPAAVAAANAPAAEAPTIVPAGGVRTTEAPMAAEEKAAKTVGILATDADAPSSFWEQAGAFFVDMGRFILYALPVILGAAALAVVFALIDRRRRKRKTDRSE